MVAKVLWTCVLQDQRKFRCDSVHVAPLETAGIITVEMIPYWRQMLHGTRGCLAWVWWRGLGLGVGLAGCHFLLCQTVGKYTALLISSLGMSGAAPSIRPMRALNLRGSCS